MEKIAAKYYGDEELSDFCKDLLDIARSAVLELS